MSDLDEWLDAGAKAYIERLKNRASTAAKAAKPEWKAPRRPAVVKKMRKITPVEGAPK